MRTLLELATSAAQEQQKKHGALLLEVHHEEELELAAARAPLLDYLFHLHSALEAIPNLPLLVDHYRQEGKDLLHPRLSLGCPLTGTVTFATEQSWLTEDGSIEMLDDSGRPVRRTIPDFVDYVLKSVTPQNSIESIAELSAALSQLEEYVIRAEQPLHTITTANLDLTNDEAALVQRELQKTIHLRQILSWAEASLGRIRVIYQEMRELEARLAHW